MIPGMNKSLVPPISYGKLLCWLCLWILMSTVDGSDRRTYGSTKETHKFDGAPFRFNKYMSRKRFEEILGAIAYTTNNPPAMLDRFWEVRGLIDAWNSKMEENFITSWMNTIDESMSKWVNEYTCPGFMCVPRKPLEVWQ